MNDNLGYLLMPKEKFEEYLKQKEFREEVVNSIPLAIPTEKTAYLLKPLKDRIQNDQI